MRKLIYIPNIHAPGDRLEASDSILSTEPKVSEVVDATSKRVWSLIEQSLNNSQFDLWGTRVFAEGICYPEQVEALRRKGIARLLSQQRAPIATYEGFLINLLKNGANIEPTEKDFLFESQMSVAQRAASIYLEIEESEDPGATLDKFQSECLSLAQAFDQITEERDHFIAGRINEVLKDGEIGFLIIGAGHKVQDFLDEDIEVEPINEELVREIKEGLELTHREISQISDVWGSERQEQHNQTSSPEKKG